MFSKMQSFCHQSRKFALLQQFPKDGFFFMANQQNLHNFCKHSLSISRISFFVFPSFFQLIFKISNFFNANWENSNFLKSWMIKCALILQLISKIHHNFATDWEKCHFYEINFQSMALFSENYVILVNKNQN